MILQTRKRGQGLMGKERDWFLLQTSFSITAGEKAEYRALYVGNFVAVIGEKKKKVDLSFQIACFFKDKIGSRHEMCVWAGRRVFAYNQG